jgi:hypothetical protein
MSIRDATLRPTSREGRVSISSTYDSTFTTTLGFLDCGDWETTTRCRGQLGSNFSSLGRLDGGNLLVGIDRKDPVTITATAAR